MSTVKTSKKRKPLNVIEGGKKGEKVGGIKALDFAGKFRVLFDDASDSILTVFRDGTVDEVNQAFQELSGYLKGEIEGMGVSVLQPDSKKQHVPERARPLHLDMFKTPGTYEDVAVLRKDGFIRLVDLNIRHVENSKSGLSIALLRDITERKRMERELITKHTELRDAYMQLEKNNLELKALQDTLVQAGKMAALGELSAGIAHEINQPLTGIRGYAQEMQAILEPIKTGKPWEAQLEVCAKEVISNADKMSKIIKYLRTFTRKSVEDHEFADVHGAIEEALKMLDRQFASRGITVEKFLDPQLPKVFANAVQLEQVFINLATNARDAIEATGRGKGHIIIRTGIESGVIVVKFKDDGAGMDSRVKQKIFNPFFTTKEVGKGMGLGLSLSYGILNKIHGSIFVESEPGKGTEFIIRIPKDYRELG